jgi:hypothetical protein
VHKATLALRPFPISCASPSDLQLFPTYSPELSGSKQQRHPVAKEEKLSEKFLNFAYNDSFFIPVGIFTISPVASVSRPALDPTQPPVQWVPGVRSPGLKSGCGVTLTNHLHLVPSSRMSRSYTSPRKCFRGVWWNSVSFLV